MGRKSRRAGGLAQIGARQSQMRAERNRQLAIKDLRAKKQMDQSSWWEQPGLKDRKAGLKDPP
jgi:hypothetical protein